MKTIEEIIEFTNQNPSTWLATAVGDQPHLRGMAMWFSDESGFYFHTGTQKRLSDQLRSNPKVEVGFLGSAEDMSQMQMVRITGAVEILDDAELERKLFEDRPWLNAIRDAYPNDKIFIFRIAHGEAQYWNMGINCREKDMAPIVF